MAGFDWNCTECFARLFANNKKSSQSAKASYKFLLIVLLVFGKDMSAVIAVAADSCRTNKAVSRLTGPKFVWFPSNRFNLQLQDMIEQNGHEVSAIHADETIELQDSWS